MVVSVVYIFNSYKKSCGPQAAAFPIGKTVCLFAEQAVNTDLARAYKQQHNEDREVKTRELTFADAGMVCHEKGYSHGDDQRYGSQARQQSDRNKDGAEKFRKDGQGKRQGLANAERVGKTFGKNAFEIGKLTIAMVNGHRNTGKQPEQEDGEIECIIGVTRAKQFLHWS